MKFGSGMLRYQVPEWKDYYFDFNAGKKMLKKCLDEIKKRQANALKEREKEKEKSRKMCFSSLVVMVILLLSHCCSRGCNPFFLQVKIL